MTSDEDKDALSIDVTRGTLRGRPFRLLRAVVLRLLTPILRLSIEGLEHVPPEGAILVVSNHLHNADPILLAIAFPRPLHFMAKKELFRIRPLGWAMRRVGTFPVDRGKADRAALRHAELVLAQGVAVAMFPEGTRSTTGTLGPAHPGAALLAVRTQVPVLPVTIVGSERLPFAGAKQSPGHGHPAEAAAPRSLTIRIGRPFVPTPSTDNRRLSLSVVSHDVMSRLADLLPPEYRGPYAEPDTILPPGPVTRR